MSGAAAADPLYPRSNPPGTAELLCALSYAALSYAVIGRRLKLSGTRWTVVGADAITTLRCREGSSQWEAICNTPHNQTGAA